MNIFIAGDSTAAPKLAEKRPEAGWGEYFNAFFTPAVTVHNYAKNGASTKSFIAEGRLQKIAAEIQAGDYFFIQFGHNDQKIDTPRGTLPDSTYQENLALFTQVALTHQATPVILSSVTRRSYQNNQIDPTCLGDYPRAAAAFAQKNHFTFLNMNQVTRDFLNHYDDDTSRQFFLQLAPGLHENYPQGVEDNTHFNQRGAQQIAQLVAETLQQSDLPLKKYLR
ncbi:rhamnogalacturonan acetylesterase [Enterococcus nangangensis]|uniref:rhamnogalacturonan acetylesterase n=1 Tax=Enterococcus nangangensis TaxID=2559926 RepID=UPI0010F707F1|nr:rhamnogalacturonan acetylesterase [Enterococcus nangangensis]